MKKSSYNPLVILDAGHGGLDHSGKYLTPHKGFSYDDTQINEGVLNRAIVYSLSFKLDFYKIRNVVITGNQDDSLADRVRKANEIYQESKNVFYLSIHHNGHSHKKAYGAEFFVHNNASEKSKELAQLAGQIFISRFGKERKLRVDGSEFEKHGTPDLAKLFKQANFKVLRETKMPAILSEWGFMTNRDEYEYISSSQSLNDQVSFWLHVIQAAIHNKMF